VLAESPLKPDECAVTIEALTAVVTPYAVVVPYSTCESLASSVVQETVAPEAEIADVATPLITGGVVSVGAEVVNVKSAEAPRLPSASLDLTR